MPQPYLPVFEGKRYSVGFRAINERPKLASAVGRCMSIWSYVDNELFGLFGILLTTDTEAAYRVFLVLRRWAHQREALDAAAEGRLSGNEMALYRALITEYGSLEAERNRLAHSCFGSCPEDEDLLFVVSVYNHVLWQADIIPKLDKAIPITDPHAGLKEKMYVYKLADLEALHQRMEKLWWDMFHFNGYLRDATNAGRIQEFEEILISKGIKLEK